MFPFVFLKIIFQIPRNIPWHYHISIVLSKQSVLILPAFCFRNLLSVIFVPNIKYFIITVWNLRSINNFYIFSPDMIILFFWKDCNVPTNHCFNDSAQFLKFSYSLFILSFINNFNFSIHIIIILHKFSRSLYCRICFDLFNRYTESYFSCPFFLVFCYFVLIISEFLFRLYTQHYQIVLK